MEPRRAVRGMFGLDPERDVEQELAFHLEMRVQELVARGESHERATQIARDRFGDYDAAREACVAVSQVRRRQMAHANYLGELVQDVRYAVRTLARSPGFTAAAVLTLAIGLTGTVSMMALVDGVLLRPLPVRAEEELFVGWRGRPEAGARRWPFTRSDLELIRAESRQLAAVAGVGYTDPWPILATDRSESFAVDAARVTGEFFDVLDVAPVLGRVLRPEDDRTGAENALVLSHGLWRSRFGSNPGVLGRRVTFGGQPFTIVGVMGRDVDHPRRVEAWTTVTAMQSTTTSPLAKAAMASELYLLARVRPGTEAAVAAEGLRTLAPALDALRPAGDGRGFVPQVRSYRDHLVGDVRGALAVLLGAVGFVLLLACANVAGLCLMRSDDRRSEFAVRAALGAGPGRLARQIFVEGVLLALLAGGLAVGAARGLLPALLTWVPNGLPRTDVVHFDSSVVAVGVTLTLVAAVVATMLPAWTSGRERLMGYLKDAQRGGTTGGRRRVRRALVAGQVALAVVGLVGIGLLVGTLQQLRKEAAVLGTAQLVIAPLVMPQAKYHDRARWRRLVTSLVESIAADSRVRAATPVNATPFSGKGWEAPVITAEGQSDDAVRGNPSLNLEEIDPSYFQTFDVPIVAGRAFTDADRDGTPRVAIVTADVAAQVWPGADPLGKRLKWGSPASKAEWLTVVGIAAPTGYRDLRAPWPSLYVPAAQMLGAADQIVVRTAMPLAQLAELVRVRARSLDPEVQLMPLRPFEELLEEPIAGPRFYALLMTVFGVTGLGLAAVGLYGVVAASVRQRRREFGVRMALGAEARDVRRLVLADGAWLVGAGVLVGLALALVVAQALRGLLYGVQPLDLPSLAGAVAGIVVVSAVALTAPLRSAGRVEPAEVLRAE